MSAAGPPPSERAEPSRRRVRWLFVALFVALPMQYAALGLISEWLREPWPALVMPAFQRVYDMTAPISVRHTHLALYCAEERVDSLSMADVFEEMPASHHVAFAAAQLQPRRLSGTPATERAGDPAVAAWAARKLAARYPLPTPCRLDVVWGDLVLSPDATGPRGMPVNNAAGRVSYRPLDTLSIALGEPEAAFGSGFSTTRSRTP